MGWVEFATDIVTILVVATISFAQAVRQAPPPPTSRPYVTPEAAIRIERDYLPTIHVVTNHPVLLMNAAVNQMMIMNRLPDYLAVSVTSDRTVVVMI